MTIASKNNKTENMYISKKGDAHQLKSSTRRSICKHVPVPTMTSVRS